MKSDEFFQKHGPKWQEILTSDLGKDLIAYLQNSRPQFQPLPQEHLVIELYGSIRGYEQCIKNIIGVAIPKPAPVQPTPNYGVPKPPEPPPFVPFSSIPEAQPKPLENK